MGIGLQVYGDVQNNLVEIQILLIFFNASQCVPRSEKILTNNKKNCVNQVWDDTVNQQMHNEPPRGD